ncbi:hypothetical protein SYNPS1DRAFT_31058 [Syncephalis pseudoplumigaleata]|uniref:Protein OS-9 homolog n=1 Tax=Syncephalis pseudoplumigaleata TaxID=1712513 RepID=A0A4P9YVH7_9FUNG|nr:hypothetical protein SYNPS1DRAFT_31058 [Syncephalis pseudoplumigaleata]|eukprot:RKP23231.1 hypothetical protein SYNPS1DRAFT_31058 [Syncephalis pseudoplumigaleata]
MCTCTIDTATDGAVVGGTRQRYLCRIPALQSSKEPREPTLPAGEAEQSTGSEAEQEWERVQNATRLLAPMAGACIYHNQGWWTYEFCYGRAARQIHDPIDDADEAMTHVLGYYDKRVPLNSNDAIHGPSDDEHAQWETHAQQEQARGNRDGVTALDVSGERRYLTQQWTDGTLCDLTGEPRYVEVQYYCNKEGEKIAYADEPGTCRYVMIVHTPLLCEDPVFAGVQRGEADKISCQLVVSDEVYARAKERAIARIQGEKKATLEAPASADTKQEEEQQKEVEKKKEKQEDVSTKRRSTASSTARKNAEDEEEDDNVLSPFSLPKVWKKQLQQQLSLLNEALKQTSSLGRRKATTASKKAKTAATKKRPSTTGQRGDGSKRPVSPKEQHSGGETEETEEEEEDASSRSQRLWRAMNPTVVTLDEHGQVQVQKLKGDGKKKQKKQKKGEDDGHEEEASKTLEDSYRELLDSLGSMEAFKDMLPKELLKGGTGQREDADEASDADGTDDERKRAKSKGKKQKQPSKMR